MYINHLRERTMQTEKFDYNKKRYWYHISTNDFGESVVFKPKEDGRNRDRTEVKLARLCVAPTIPQCIVALPLWIDDFDNFEYPSIPRKHSLYVYQSDKKRIAKEPYFRRKDLEKGEIGLPFDYGVTKEGWIVRPASFKKIGMLGANINNESFLDIDLEVCTIVDIPKSIEQLEKIKASNAMYFYSIDGKKIKLKNFNYDIDGGIEVKSKTNRKNLILTPA